MITTPVIRYHGAKFRLAPWILSHFPPHRTYVESFGGAAGVLMQKKRAYSEVYNDLDGDIVNFFRVLQNENTRQQLFERLALTPYARAEFERAYEDTDCPIQRACNLAIRAQMGFGSSGATKGSTGFRSDTSRDYSTVQALWAKYPQTIAAVGMRLQGVLIENRPAIDVMQQHDRPDTLHFIDPPYIHATRSAMRNGRQNYYRFEMSDEQHEELLHVANALTGMAIICGYDSALYNDLLHGWVKHSKEARMSAGRGTGIRTEVIWINPVAAENHKRDLFNHNS